MLVCVTAKSPTSNKDKEWIHKTKAARVSKHLKTGLSTISYKPFSGTLQGAVLPSKK
jgi:hypothetical protein